MGLPQPLVVSVIFSVSLQVHQNGVLQLASGSSIGRGSGLDGEGGSFEGGASSLSCEWQAPPRW